MVTFMACFRGNSSDDDVGETVPLHHKRVHLYSDNYPVMSDGLPTHSGLLRPDGNEVPIAVCAEAQPGERSTTYTELKTNMSPMAEQGWKNECNAALAEAEGGFTVANVDDTEQYSFGPPSPSSRSLDAAIEKKGARAVQDVLNAFGNGRYQVLVFCVCGLAWSADGCLLTALPLSMPILEEQWMLSSVSQAALLSSVGLGETIGALGLGALSDRLGRRKTLMLAELLCVLFASAAFFARGFWSLLLCQLLLGSAVGGSIPIAFSLLVESLADTHKDRVLCLMQVWFKAGMVVDILLGWVLVKYGWRVLMLASGVPPLLVLLPLLFLVEESPVHLQNQGYPAKAAKALESIGRWNRKRLLSDNINAIGADFESEQAQLTNAAKEEDAENISIITTLTSPVTDEEDESISIVTEDTADPELQAVRYHNQVDPTAGETNNGAPASGAGKSPLQEYITIVLQKVTIRTAFMWLTINLGSGLYLWYPAIATHMGAGDAGEFGGSLVANLIGIAAFVLAAFNTARVGHARLLVGSCVACAMAIGAMSAGVAAGNVVTMVAGYITWMFFFDIAWPVIYAVSPQLFDAKTRTTAFGFASGFGKLGILISPWFRVIAGTDLGDSSQYLVLVYGVFWVATGYLAYHLRRAMPRHCDVDK